MLVGLAKAATVEDARTLGLRAVRAGKRQKTAAIVLPEGNEAEVRRAALGALSAGYRYEEFKSSGKRRKGGVKTVQLLVADAKDKALRGALRDGKALGEAINLVRDLVNGPPNVVDPLMFAETAEKAAAGVKSGALTCTVYDKEWITEEKMALFLAVNAGAEKPPRMIHLAYKPEGAKARVVFVGKGLTFDAGGLCLKPAGSMVDMKCDMAGGATTLGVLVAAAEMGLPIEVHGVIGCTENLLGAGAYRPSDVYTARSGKTVEIINTDAEGRLVLADVLDWSLGLEPDYLIDHATLTGACMVALGKYRAALYANDDALGQAYERAAEASGESYWRLPLDAALEPSLKSDVADVKHTGSRYGGSITAALFLQHFVGKAKWAHLDIAGPAFLDGANGRYPKGGTGFGVETAVALLEQLAAPEGEPESA